MKPLNNKDKTKLLRQIVQDLKSATGITDAIAKQAGEELKAGRSDNAICALLEIEPRIYDAKKLFLLATYVKNLGNYGSEQE